MRRRIDVFLFLAMLTALIEGCTTRAWYQNMQSAAIQAYHHQPPPEQTRCEARVNKQDFETYEKQRSRM